LAPLERWNDIKICDGSHVVQRGKGRIELVTPRVSAAGAHAPAAHIQLHAHRDEIVCLASLPSKLGARQRADRGTMSTLSDLHIPVAALDSVRASRT
jgi:hypothetical protein